MRLFDGAETRDYPFTITTLPSQVVEKHNTGPPIFDYSFKNPIELMPGENFTLQLPSITDPDLDEYSVEFSLGSALLFSTVSPDQRSITFKPEKKDINTHTVQITLADKNSQ